MMWWKMKEHVSNLIMNKKIYVIKADDKMIDYFLNKTVDSSLINYMYSFSYSISYCKNTYLSPRASPKVIIGQGIIHDVVQNQKEFECLSWKMAKNNNMISWKYKNYDWIEPEVYSKNIKTNAIIYKNMISFYPELLDKLFPDNIIDI